MSEIKHRIIQLRETLGIKTLNEFSEKLNISRTTLIGYEKGSSPPSAEFLSKINEIFNVDINWLLNGSGEMLVVPRKEEKFPLKVNLKAMIDQQLAKVEAQIAEIRARLREPGEPPSDSGMYTADPEPEYRLEKTNKILFVENIAAGPPINQSDDLSNYVEVPRAYIKTGRPEDYYAARIQGESMTAAGIPDHCMVLIRRSDVPKTGVIQVVRYGGKSTLKRMHEDEDHQWTLYYEDDSNRSITIEPGEDYQVQGDFVRVLS